MNCPSSSNHSSLFGHQNVLSLFKHLQILELGKILDLLRLLYLTDEETEAQIECD